MCADQMNVRCMPTNPCAPDVRSATKRAQRCEDAGFVGNGLRVATSWTGDLSHLPLQFCCDRENACSPHIHVPVRLENDDLGCVTDVVKLLASTSKQ